MKLQRAEFWIFTCSGYPNFGFILGCGWTEICKTASFLRPSDRHTVTQPASWKWTYVLILCHSESWSAPIEYYMVLLWWYQFLEHLMRYVAVHSVCTTAHICGLQCEKICKFCFENKGVFVWKALTAIYPVHISVKYRFKLSECSMV
jgi:hypothetical protein